MRRIAVALQTIKSEDPQEITLRVNTLTFRNPVGETVYQEWTYLDRLLVQFPTSRSVRPKVVYEMNRDEEDIRGGGAFSLRNFLYVF